MAETKALGAGVDRITAQFERMAQNVEDLCKAVRLLALNKMAEETGNRDDQERSRTELLNFLDSHQVSINGKGADMIQHEATESNPSESHIEEVISEMSSYCEPVAIQEEEAQSTEERLEPVAMGTESIHHLQVAISVSEPCFHFPNKSMVVDEDLQHEYILDDLFGLQEEQLYEFSVNDWDVRHPRVTNVKTQPNAHQMFEKMLNKRRGDKNISERWILLSKTWKFKFKSQKLQRINPQMGLHRVTIEYDDSLAINSPSSVRGKFKHSISRNQFHEPSFCYIVKVEQNLCNLQHTFMGAMKFLQRHKWRSKTPVQFIFHNFNVSKENLHEVEIRYDNRNDLLNHGEVLVFAEVYWYGWFSDVGSCFCLSQCETQERLAMIPLSLDGDALKWGNKEMAKSVFEDWKHTKCKFVKEHDGDYEDPLESFDAHTEHQTEREATICVIDVKYALKLYVELEPGICDHEREQSSCEDDIAKPHEENKSRDNVSNIKEEREEEKVSINIKLHVFGIGLEDSLPLSICGDQVIMIQDVTVTKYYMAELAPINANVVMSYRWFFKLRSTWLSRFDGIVVGWQNWSHLHDWVDYTKLREWIELYHLQGDVNMLILVKNKKTIILVYRMDYKQAKKVDKNKYTKTTRITWEEDNAAIGFMKGDVRIRQTYSWEKQLGKDWFFKFKREGCFLSKPCGQGFFKEGGFDIGNWRARVWF